ARLVVDPDFHVGMEHLWFVVSTDSGVLFLDAIDDKWTLALSACERPARLHSARSAFCEESREGSVAIQAFVDSLANAHSDSPAPLRPGVNEEPPVSLPRNPLISAMMRLPSSTSVGR